jgi:hypothetical protein
MLFFNASKMQTTLRGRSGAAFGFEGHFPFFFEAMIYCTGSLTKAGLHGLVFSAEARLGRNGISLGDE